MRKNIYIFYVNSINLNYEYLDLIYGILNYAKLALHLSRKIYHNCFVYEFYLKTSNNIPKELYFDIITSMCLSVLCNVT